MRVCFVTLGSVKSILILHLKVYSASPIFGVEFEAEERVCFMGETPNQLFQTSELIG